MKLKGILSRSRRHFCVPWASWIWLIVSIVLVSLNGKVVAQNNQTNVPVSTLTPSNQPSKGPTRAPKTNTTRPPVKPPTPTPTKSPTSTPTKSPTSTPTKSPTSTPTKSPTSTPTKSPTSTPTKSPTSIPSKAPTPIPSKAPTKLPTITVTESPTKTPSTSPSPSKAPTASPVTQVPTTAPTGAPSRSPSKSPSSIPSPSPSNSPSKPPTLLPTPPPQNVTLPPVTLPPVTLPPVTLPPVTSPPTSPALAPSTPSPKPDPVTPAPSITPAPTYALQKPETVQNLYIIFEPFSPMDPETVQFWEQGTSTYYENYYNLSPEENDYQTNIFNMSVVTRVTSQDPPYQANRQLLFLRDKNNNISRRTQSRIQKVTYQQTFEYRTTDESVTLRDIIETPMMKNADRLNYIDTLQKESTNAFDNLETSSDVRQEEVVIEDKTGIGTTNIIIIVVCSVGGLILISGGYLLMSRKKKKGKDLSDPIPGSQVHISTYNEYGQDEVSTLAEPAPRLGVMSSNESLAGYEDKSIATVDYDYSKAYGGGEGSVSSAGGTLGSGTRGGASQVTGGDTISTPAAPGQSLFSDDGSFDAHYQDAPVKEELIDIYAPPGKLGVVIDTPDDGAPVVHAIKDSSVIADKLKVGDKLVAVDDEDVRSMTAIKVSKLISRKSANATRKLSVIRSSIVE